MAGRVPVWYRVRNLEAGRAFYSGKLGFAETYFDAEGRWVRLERGGMEIGLTQGDPEDGGVATVDVDDIKEEAERLRREDVRVGVVVELRGEIRLLDVFDPDGNRVQLAQELRE
jgi:catechol 2,3-dioxygenase-like lactoylglutathione lyase family enzyme